MATLINSNVLIAAEQGQLNFDAIAAEGGVAISTDTASELLHGVHRARAHAQHHRRQAFVEGLMAQLPVIAFDLIVARYMPRFGPLSPNVVLRWASVI